MKRGDHAPQSQTYQGVERRRHRVFITRNSEYHFRDGLCVAVRDRRDGDWIPDHVALHRPLSGSLKFSPDGAIRPTIGEPRLGEALFFATGGRDLVTSPLIEVRRPDKRVVESYPSPHRRPARVG